MLRAAPGGLLAVRPGGAGGAAAQGRRAALLGRGARPARGPGKVPPRPPLAAQASRLAAVLTAEGVVCLLALLCAAVRRASSPVVRTGSLHASCPVLRGEKW
eukprot:scaffold3195_cov321-Prasinococcus_capsulatus_cf.AAC.6